MTIGLEFYYSDLEKHFSICKPTCHYIRPLAKIELFFRIAPETTIDGQCVLTTLHKYVEIMINILACDFDDVSITVTEFAKSYLHVSIILPFYIYFVNQL